MYQIIFWFGESGPPGVARTAANGILDTQKNNFGGINTTERQPGPKWLQGRRLILSNGYLGGCCRDYLLVRREWAKRLARTVGNGNLIKEKEEI